MYSGTASLPMSCSSAAVLTPRISLSLMPSDLRQAAGEPLDTAHVLGEGVVLGVDGRGQGLDRRQVQVGDLAHLPLFVGQALEVDVVAAIGQQRRHRDRQQQHDGADVAERRHEGGRGGGADDVARRRPQEVGVPHGQRRGAARPGDGERDRATW